MKAEAKIAWAPGVKVFACGGDVESRVQAIRRAAAAGAPAIVSFGIAGGLGSHLKPGDWVVAAGVISGGQRIATDFEWSKRLAGRLIGAELSDIASVGNPVLRPLDKRRLRDGTGAAVVDMESYQAALLAKEFGVPFAAVRVVADPADRELPPAARLGLQPDGTVSINAVIRSLLGYPSQIPSLARVTGDAWIAFRALLRGRNRLGPHFGSAMCPTVFDAGLALANRVSSQAEPLPA